MNWWTPQEIRDLYDSDPNMTLKQLSRITGRDIRSLKKVLMPVDAAKSVSAYVAEGLGEK